MKNYLLFLSILVINCSLVLAQGNIFENSDFEEQGEWSVVQTSTTDPVTVEFGSSAFQVNGGQGGNMLITYTVPSEQQVFVYQELELEAEKEYEFTLAFANLIPDNTCWWVNLFYCADEPTEGNDITETPIIQASPWQDYSYNDFNGLLDTSACEEGSRFDKNKFTVEADSIYYVGICFGGCAVGEEFVLAIDNLKIFDPDLEPDGISSVTEIINEFSFSPNPASNNIEISYNLSQRSDIDITIFNSLGQKMITLNDGIKLAGTHEQSFNCSNFVNGVYYIILRSDNNSLVKRMVISK